MRSFNKFPDSSSFSKRESEIVIKAILIDEIFNVLIKEFMPASYVENFQSKGGSFIMLAKGNRSNQVTKACKQYGGFYLGSIGGPAASLAQKCIRNVKCIEYSELGMEAIWQIEVENFPAFIVVDDKGNDFFSGLMRPDN